MKEETKEHLIFAFAFLGIMTTLAGGFGIALSIVEGIETMIASIPFWIIAIPSFIFAFILKKDLDKNPTKR